MRILLADDQPNVRSALRLLLEQEAGLTVVAEAEDSKELVSHFEVACPELVLLDWELPGGKSAELIPALRAKCPELAIIVLSSRPEAHRAALDAGAESFVSKGSPPQEVITSVKNISGQMKPERRT
jgi:DNA-binding NarL/FixJ family response regulator